jgi:hypothetical protein
LSGGEEGVAELLKTTLEESFRGYVSAALTLRRSGL